MIQSPDTYVYNQFKQKLNAILKNEYVVDNALARLDIETRENFKRSFVGEKPKRKVEVSYSFPQVKEKFEARLVIQMGSGSVITESIGNVEGTFTYRELGTYIENSTVEMTDGEFLRIPLKKEIGEITTIEELSFSAQDNVHESGTDILFRKSGNEQLIGIPLTVHYIAKEKQEEDSEGNLVKDPKGLKIGFTSRETVVVTPLSTSMDTARCLDALVKVVLITMLESPSGNNEYLLQSHKFEEMSQVIPEPLDRIVFGRPLELSYDVSNNLDFDYIKEITELNIKY